MNDDRFFEPGDTIHGYVVERLAAVGGTAAVYEARDPILGRSVAIKILRRAGAGVSGWRTLGGEGRRTARLEHPAFVTIYGLFEDGERTALVMEWVDGMTLAERFARRPLDPAETNRIFHAIAAALTAAHAAGLVHGDLSPANVMIRDDGQVKILDPAPPPAPDGSRATPATRSYAAPEVVRGGPPSRAADVFAFGAMLAEALAQAKEHGAGGRPPRRLARLVRSCTEEDPSRRPEAVAVEGELQRGGRASSTGRRRLVVAAVILTLATAALWWQRRHVPPERSPWNGMERLQVNGSLPVVLEDGSAVVYRTADERGLAELPLASGHPRTIWHGEAPIEGVAVFPDGRNLLFVSRTGAGGPWLWEVGLEGGLPRKVAPGSVAAIAPDGRRLAVIQRLPEAGSRVVLLGRDGTLGRSLHTFDRSMVPVALVFGPSGRSVLVATTDGVRLSRLLRIGLDDGTVEPVTEIAGVAARGAALHRGLEAVVWPVRTEPRGEASLMVTSLVRPACRVVYPGPGRASNPTLDAAGRILAFQLTESDTELVELAVHAEGGPPVETVGIVPGSRGASQPRIGPDPRMLLFQSALGTVQLMDRSNGEARPLVATGAPRYNPTWSPDGHRAVCAGLVEGRSDLWLVAVDGGAPERLTEQAGNNFQPVWHPDGQHIVFISDRGGADDLYILDLATGQVHRLGTEGAANPAISSDGRHLAYLVGAYGPAPRLRMTLLSPSLDAIETVWERPVIMNRWAGGKPRFSPDGRWLAFDQPRAGTGADIWVVPVEGGGTARARRLTALPFAASLTSWFDWGPDWKIVATVVRRTDRICILHDARWWLEHAR
ncbi:MAG TPA: serine/threonine-protein kinase [Acidobacteria bacterium]|nr:serine/threonine-protein kinase [Acidobacteriota bacterium]